MSGSSPVVGARRVRRGVVNEAALPDPRRALLVVLLLALLPAACGRPGELGRVAPNSTIITEEELGRIHVATAYDAVERLRPDFLRGRGPVSQRNPDAGRPVVYIAGVRQQGGPAVLRQVRFGDVREIQYLGGVDATTRYGTDHAGGAILVFLR
jgi:hypothetical protein